MLGYLAKVTLKQKHLVIVVVLAYHSNPTASLEKYDLRPYHTTYFNQQNNHQSYEKYKYTTHR